ncbi:ribonucleotide reductase assembly protein NrdI [Streptococcus chenjunshii]|uniref:Putative NrdI-like protein n=1 Tax=Streptococcus chenjunshii TaxID=2173853 RepID=A0A372KNF7_9STRE|nr:class Ib ribonucleoside-diphosphate reductase assembly flavoprotein NrdI [Streptococcus chenjunshii]AXQ77797.1 ribonucleotide reductase assembly protein NrdI [Streptococcus chenjunshii]RFU51307.1 ribonucleotide reductase assembly protein NrdI [Streptococcus chenjunshii]RFU53819.1 ribonucleotide reductase assembly protein NrdI [Streptococcus chenjunshii]
MSSLTIVYISLSGNTHSFVTRLSDYLNANYGLSPRLINIKDLRHETFSLSEPFVAVLPTYLEGGNGLDNGDQEILTTPLGDFIAAHNNYQHCFGIIGSGNRNFNNQFCLTAKQYAKRFGFPVLDEFELRGTSRDIERIAEKILQTLDAFTG